MMEKGPKLKYVDIRPIPFQNDDTINAHLENTGNYLVALKPKSPLYFVVYAVSNENSSTPFNLALGFANRSTLTMTEIFAMAI